MRKTFILVFVLMLVIVGSCYYDSEEALYPAYNKTCDTTNVTFSSTIMPILKNNCLACHSSAAAAAAGGNIAIDTYASVVAKQQNIIGAIKHTGSYSPMPKNSSMLGACLITQWDLWVKKGMPNN
jgi:hypothetical protein